MKNPNNKKIPNLWIDDRKHAEEWITRCREMGLDAFLMEPRKFVGNGLSYAESIFLEKTLERYNQIMESNE